MGLDRDQVIKLHQIHFDDQVKATMAEAQTLRGLGLPPWEHDNHLTVLGQRLEDLRAQNRAFWARPDIRS